jgi:hypothetical protein
MTHKKQQLIRKKLSCQKLSAAHIKACEIASLAKKNNGNIERKITS